jgi:DNA polymerase-3 subunit beta
MRVLVDRLELVKVLSDLNLVIRENSIRPAISGTCLIAKNGEIEFIGTNLELTLKSRMQGEVLEDGKVVFKINMILEYIKLLEKEKVEIRVDESKLYIHNAEFLIYDAEDYPNITELSPEKKFNIEIEKLMGSLEKVKMAAATTSDNLAINCVRLASKPGKVEFVGTDSYRMAYYLLEKSFGTEFEVSIPLETVNVMTKLFKDTGSKLEIAIEGSQMEFYSGNVTLKTRLVDMPFPDYQTIIDDLSYNKKVEMNQVDFKSALKKVLTVAKRNQETKDGALFDFMGNKLKITVSSGSAKITQKIDTIKEGDDLKTSLNVRYIMDYIGNIDNNVVLSATNSSSMFIFNEVGNSNYTYILMPLALSD